MAQRLKSWESPRHQRRNSKGKGGSARQRQLKKQRQMLRQKLKRETSNQNQDWQNQEKRTDVLFSFYLSVWNQLPRMQRLGGDMSHKVYSACLTQSVATPSPGKSIPFMVSHE